jgi:L-iditol 2-dehydrogenase
MADYFVAQEDLVFGLPASISDEAGALIEPLAVAVWACRKAQVGPGANVLVTGAGPIGLLTAQVAIACGAAGVTITDVSESRLRHAGAIGGMRTVDARAGGIGALNMQADALIECSGSGLALLDALGALRPAGTAVLVGMGQDEVTLPLDLIQRRELWVTGTFRYANVYPAAIALAAERRVDLEALITDRYDLEHADAALRCSRDDEAAVKVLVLPRGRTS